MKSNETVQIRQQNPSYPVRSGFFGGQQGGGGSPYPGLEQQYFGGTPNLPTSYTPQTPGVGGGSSGGSGFNLNLNQVKGFIDRMGGIDGIVGTMTRVQKMVSSFQQVAPMLKLLIGSFASAKASAKSFSGNDLGGSTYSRRKRRRKSRRGLKKYRPPAGKTWTRTGKKRR